MNRDQKAAEIENLKQTFVKAELAILTDYKGLKVNEFNELRRKLHEKGSHLQVVKNRLAKIALKGTPFEVVLNKFAGTTALTTTDKDPIGPAKVLTDFAKDHELVSFKVAVMNGRVLSKGEIESLASLPSKEALLAKLMGSMQAPATRLVSVMAQIPRRLATVLAAVRDQKAK